MWFLFAMLAAVAAASVVDMMVSSNATDDDAEVEKRDDEALAEQEPRPGSGSLLLDMHDDAAMTAAEAMQMAGEQQELRAPTLPGVNSTTGNPELDAADRNAPDRDATGALSEIGTPAQSSGPIAPDSGGNDTGPNALHDPSAGLHDHLGERIHSSDSFPPALPPVPGLVNGTDGNDSLRGSGAGDTLNGGAGDDTLVGAGGDSVLIAGGGNNHLIGGEGNDRLIGDSGNDTLEGGWGNDLLIAGGGENLLMGGAGDDTLVGAMLDADGKDTSGANFLNGGAGKDLLIAGQGDQLHGGEGADVFALGDWLAGAEPATILDYNAHQDQITLHYDPDRLDPPIISISFTADDPDTAQIRLDGQVVALVLNAPDLATADIALVAGLPAELLAAE